MKHQAENNSGKGSVPVQEKMHHKQPDPVAAALARIYALILAWPAPQEKQAVEGGQGSEAQSPSTADTADPKKDLSS